MPKTSKPSISLFMRSISFLTINTLAYNICVHRCYLSEGARETGFSVGGVSVLDDDERPIWIAGAHRDDGRRFIVRADEKLTAFAELEAAVRTTLIYLTGRPDFCQTPRC